MAAITKTRGGSAEQFRTVAASFDAGMPPAFTQAMRSVVIALGYEDRPLVRSHLETAITALAETVGDSVGKCVALSRSSRAHLGRAAGEVGGSPGEEFDEEGRVVAGELDRITRSLVTLRDGSVRELNLAGVVVPGADALEAEIAEMRSFQASFVGGWPWSHLPKPAADPALLARARAGSERGEGVPIEDLIHQIEAGD